METLMISNEDVPIFFGHSFSHIYCRAPDLSGPDLHIQGPDSGKSLNNEISVLLQ